MAYGLRGSAEWKDWLTRFAESRRLTIATLLDQALVEHAERHGFDPPPRR